MESEGTTEGIVYVLENEAFSVPVVKIGKTINLPRRLAILNTAVPLPFRCYKASRVKDRHAVEQTLHQRFSEAHEGWHGEFFEVNAADVAAELSKFEIDDVTCEASRKAERYYRYHDPTQALVSRKLEDIEADADGWSALDDQIEKFELQTEKGNGRAKNITTKMLQLSTGYVLTFKHDQNITCTILDNQTTGQ